MRFIFIFFFFWILCFSQSVVDGVVAVVGKNIVLHGDVLQQTQFVAQEKQLDPSKNPYLFEQLYYTTRDNLINKYAVLDIAEKDTNIIISNDEVDRALDQQIDDFISRAGSEKQFLEMAGISMRQIRSDYWKDIYNMMLIERFQFSIIQNIDVSRKEVREFYYTYKDSIPSLPEQYDFSIIEIPFVSGFESEKETESFLYSLKNDIENNSFSFDSLAKIHSHDPATASSGGYLGFTTRGSFVLEYEEVAYSLSPGQISDPIKTEFGYHLIRLIERQGEKISTQHILQTVTFSEIDKKNIYSLINDVYHKTIGNSDLFDSLANIYAKKYQNYSGKYQNYSPDNIPKNILLNLDLLEPFQVSSPFETDNGYALIYFYNHQKKMIPDLNNSWNLMYNYAKQKKQTVFFQSWIDNMKNKIYIRIIK